MLLKQTNLCFIKVKHAHRTILFDNYGLAKQKYSKNFQFQDADFINYISTSISNHGELCYSRSNWPIGVPVKINPLLSSRANVDENFMGKYE